jgi:ABC-2 type transport system ATP-binding protein
VAGPAIVTRELTKHYGDAVAVDRLDLTVERGEVFGLLGPNGAGKTTTILMLLGLSEPTSGTADVLGLDPVRQALEVKRRVGYVPDSVGFYDDLTGRENLRYTARLNRLARSEAEARIDAVLGEVSLEDRANDPVGTYSRGMRQRLGVADALVKSPAILIMDEPTVAIDPEGVDELLALIRRLRGDRGVTVLLSSHLLQQVQSVCDRIGIFVGGRLVAHGSISELSAAHGDRTVIEVGVASGDPEPALRAVPEVLDVRRDGELYLVGASRDIRPEIARGLVDAGHVPVHVRLRAEELGEIYRRYFMEERDARSSAGVG